MNYISYILFVFILLHQEAWSQVKVYMKDPNLTTCLKNIDPTAFSGDSLIVSEAAKFTQKIDCSSKNISQIDGIQYFTKTTEIAFNSNLIKVIPSLAGMNALQIVNFDKNVLDSVASFQPLPNLKDISMVECKLRKLPSFNGMATLRNLQFPNNNLAKIPDFKGCVNIQKLSFRNTSTLDSLPDYSFFPNITTVYFENMNLTKVPDLSKNLQLSSVLLSGNNFTFKDLLQMTKWPTFSALKQDIKEGMNKVQMPTSFSAKENGALEIKIPMDDTVSTNRYYLYKNTVLQKDSKQNSFIFDKISTSDTGFYHVEVINTSPSLDTIGLRLSTSNFRISVVPCFDQSIFQFSITSQDCKKGINISIDESKFQNANAPFLYSIFNVNTSQNQLYESPEVPNLVPANYKVNVNDANGCGFQSSFELKKQTICDDVINPKSEGANKFFYFNYNGSVKILGPIGKIIRTYTANGFWDGTDGDGKIVPIGYYTLLAETGESWHVTVLH